MADPTFEEIFPEDPELTPEEELAATEDALEDDDAVLTADPAPQPIGRSWAFDFVNERFVPAGHGPLATYGDQTLRGWIEKCIRTEAGAHPIHPPGYGMRRPVGDYLGTTVDLDSLAELEQDIEEALTFHPAITRVDDFDIQLGDDPEGDGTAAEVGFTVVTDDGSDIQFSSTLRTGEVLDGDLQELAGG